MVTTATTKAGTTASRDKDTPTTRQDTNQPATQTRQDRQPHKVSHAMPEKKKLQERMLNSSQATNQSVYKVYARCPRPFHCHSPTAASTGSSLSAQPSGYPVGRWLATSARRRTTERAFSRWSEICMRRIMWTAFFSVPILPSAECVEDSELAKKLHMRLAAEDNKPLCASTTKGAKAKPASRHCRSVSKCDRFNSSHWDIAAVASHIVALTRSPIAL